ncbi:MAG: HD domain-containing protein [Defluviitaleaceae bacterium]|nr:HD domain-containing protein [Defluviitaleaceae bacterium]
MGYQFTSEEILILNGIKEKWEEGLSENACKSEDARREFDSIHDDDALRTAFAVDVDKIINNPLYNRGTDKTQVFSLYRNDDITRRSLHMQLVSRIARNLGRILGLNLDLIEAIAIGHDVGHTPFGHKGEDFLNELYHQNTGRYFHHNVHSVRVLQKITRSNLALQTLNGILCHCGEDEFEKYVPRPMDTFDELNQLVEKCYTLPEIKHLLRPSTLEGCLVRICDIIAYIGKDRQDARKVRLLDLDDYPENILGTKNADIINNIQIDIIKHSLGQPYIAMSPQTLAALRSMRKDNNESIYQNPEIADVYFEVIQPMMERLYGRFLQDVRDKNHASPIFQHYLNNRILGDIYRHPEKRYVYETESNYNDAVADFIASMTDDYFVDVFRHLFADSPLNAGLKYIEYFDRRNDEG